MAPSELINSNGGREDSLNEDEEEGVRRMKLLHAADHGRRIPSTINSTFFFQYLRLVTNLKLKIKKLKK